MTIATITPRDVVLAGYDDPVSDWVRLLRPAAELAEVVANTEFVPRGMRGKPAAVTAVILAAHELGIGPMTGLRTVDVVEGKVSLSAELIRGLVLRAGHEIWVKESTGQRVTVCGKRAGSSHETEVTWTLDDARRAKLDGKTNWRTYPRQMLQARATAELGRLIFADVLAGLTATEELDDGDTTDTPDTAAGGRKRARRTPVTVVVAEPRPAPPDDGADDLPLPDSAPPAADPGLTEGQRKRLHATFNDLDVADRDQRLAIASRIVGRDLPSSNDLTKDEAGLIIDTLARAENDPQVRADLGFDERPAPSDPPPDDTPDE